MDRGEESFVHVFLFECGGCGNPLAAACVSAAQNIEQIDTRCFSLKCSVCGWSGEPAGAAAKKRWVDSWEPENPQFGSRI